MTSSTRTRTPPPARSRSRALTAGELAAFGAELDALRARTVADLGKRDADYIRNVVKAVRYIEAAGRALLFIGAVSLAFRPGLMLPLCGIGTLLLGIAKILENMELGHNVMHGQYDWMNDPALNGRTYEWDIVGTSDNWRKTHNFKHHTYTNVRGMDDDIGYGLLRLFPEQRWRPFFLAQPVIAVIFALLFEWGVAIQDLELGKYFAGRKSKKQLREEWQPVARKMRRQLVKDYVIFPLLAGPFFLPVLVGNLIANVIRNLWTYMIIFCGHFTANAETFPKSVTENESRGHWYLRQMRGSSNLKGGRLFHIMSGNLSHQIEHHLFPDIPARRYADMAPVVQDICRRYGQHYNTGRLSVQFGQVVWRILRHAFPSRPPKRTQAALVEQAA
ncbi:fatty acid desaturase family protein [Amnimonas aquatica]|uniref:Acyl-CoA desaturase n=1 Tax=Amnimonas aquatica TaxID=2094561 RepID=A0A2P6ASY0_9GAMM|nr:acyl-CoA desaturase [Amnimonas aquatica]PQA45234.1 acyl-CoA desaturase [Amnimonas aquatica]